MFKIVNDRKTDHHIHSCNFSDGINTIEEIVQYAGKLKMKEITISDHCDATQDILNKIWGVKQNTFRYNIPRFKNVWNNVKINFSVEADLLDENGNVSTTIQKKDNEKFILSCHPDVYKGNFKKITDGYEKAIEKYKNRIICIAHPCLNVTYDNDIPTVKYLDIERLVKCANKYNVPLELNGANLIGNKDDMPKLKIMLKNAKYIMVNSDAHTLHEIKDNIDFAYKWLNKEGYL